MGALITLSLLAYGLAAAGSVSIGVALTLTGLTFTGVALVAAQLTDGTRAMYGITGAVIAVAYVLRAIGDVTENGLSWLSPIGWGQAMHPFSGERWWPAVAAGRRDRIASSCAALALFARRDVGSGLWPARPGPAARAVDCSAPSGSPGACSVARSSAGRRASSCSASASARSATTSRTSMG